MSTQINMKVHLNTSDKKAADIIENHSEFMIQAIYTALHNVLCDHGLARVFTVSVQGPEVVFLRD